MPVLERLYSSEREAIHVISERRIEHARKEQTLWGDVKQRKQSRNAEGFVFKTVVTVGLSGVEMTCSGLKQGVGF